MITAVTHDMFKLPLC